MKTRTCVCVWASWIEKSAAFELFVDFMAFGWSARGALWRVGFFKPNCNLNQFASDHRIKIHLYATVFNAFYVNALHIVQMNRLLVWKTKAQMNRDSCHLLSLVTASVFNFFWVFIIANMDIMRNKSRNSNIHKTIHSVFVASRWFIHFIWKKKKKKISIWQCLPHNKEFFGSVGFSWHHVEMLIVIYK